MDACHWNSIGMPPSRLALKIHSSAGAISSYCRTSRLWRAIPSQPALRGDSCGPGLTVPVRGLVCMATLICLATLACSPVSVWGQSLGGNTSVPNPLPLDGILQAQPLSKATPGFDGMANPATALTSSPVDPIPVTADAVNEQSWESIRAERLASYRNVGVFQNGVYVTNNFIVRASNANLAAIVGDQAEAYRAVLAEQWLGQALPDWQAHCPIEVIVSHQAHGETSFLLSEDGNGLPQDWDMKIYGPSDRLLDSVLPHEVTHSIFATYFRQRLPRWADEGACTTVEHPSEREKIHTLLLRFLSPQQRQGIPFNHMFPMRDYPSDMLPLYAQGYSVAKFLIAQGGHRQFVGLIERGLQLESTLPVTVAWDRAMQLTYGYENLSELQLDWLQWVARGSSETEAVARMEQRSQIRLAAASLPITAVPNTPSASTATMETAPSGMERGSDMRNAMLIGNPGSLASSMLPSGSGVYPNQVTELSAGNFYVQQMRQSTDGQRSAAASSLPPGTVSPPSYGTSPPTMLSGTDRFSTTGAIPMNRLPSVSPAASPPGGMAPPTFHPTTRPLSRTDSTLVSPKLIR
jgi:hypothetical protein